MNFEEVNTFDTLYSSNAKWKQNKSYSGPGSDVKHTDKLVEFMPFFIKKYEIKSIVDVPCGDFNYMKHVNLDGINYNGYDISKECIKMCEKYAKKNINFSTLDITKDKIPQVDLVIVKDLFLHLSFKHIKMALQNILKSKPKYISVSHYPQRVKNEDMNTGFGCRPIDLFIEPFNLKYKIIERTTYSDNYNGDEMLFLKINNN